MVRIAAKDGSKQRPGFGFAAEPKEGLSLKKQGRRHLPRLKVLIEEKHRGERGREIIYFRGFLLEVAGAGKQVAEDLLRFLALAEFFSRYSRVIGQLAECPDGHLLEVAFEVRGGGPIMKGGFDIAGQGAGATEPVMDIALVREQMFGFAEVVRRGESALEVRAGGREVMMHEGGAAQRSREAFDVFIFGHGPIQSAFGCRGQLRGVRAPRGILYMQNRALEQISTPTHRNLRRQRPGLGTGPRVANFGCSSITQARVSWAKSTVSPGSFRRARDLSSRGAPGAFRVISNFPMAGTSICRSATSGRRSASRCADILREAAAGKPLEKIAANQATGPDWSALDPTAQIRLFGKLKLQNCAEKAGQL